MSQNPKLEQALFAGRARFDIIVYYDQNSNNIESLSAPMINVKRVLELQQLRRSPMMLVGGFEAWQLVVGETGVFRFPVAKEKKHWLRSNRSNSSLASNVSNEYENRSLYDYVSILNISVNYKKEIG